MIYMIRDKNTGLYYRNSRGTWRSEDKGYWTKTPRTFSQKGHIKLSMGGLLADYQYRLLGNIPADGYDWWTMDQNRAVWNNWKRVSDRPLEELLPPEWELIEIDPSRHMPIGEQQG